MNVLELAKPYREALGVHEGLRKLGYAADDIYFLVTEVTGARGTRRLIFVKLMVDDREFNIGVGELSGSTQSIMTTWRMITQAIGNDEVPQHDLDTIWQQSMPHQRSFDFVMALLAKGFMPPKPGRLAPKEKDDA